MEAGGKREVWGNLLLMKFVSESTFLCVHTMYRKFDLCIPTNETAHLVPIPTFIYLWEIYIFPWSVFLFGCSKTRHLYRILTGPSFAVQQSDCEFVHSVKLVILKWEVQYTEDVYQRDFECFIEDQAFSTSYDLAPGPPLTPRYRQQIVSLSPSSCLSPVELTYGRGVKGVSEEPNHTILESLLISIKHSMLSDMYCWLRLPTFTGILYILFGIL